ncbi:hypothetical protein BKA60DRAFT_174654 [Fusarium oxysporum]|uniref:Oxidoreductase n=1 Tax=Fusarium oxysporum TaxID=5507 RepID=A0A420M9R7_FUSOX|nr:hypothetical protein BKA60DRAFT_174654 [Fusarium oxysporum]RKK63199.1 hypothetical protein BFJ69_g16927 [Fusarium oxysporum]
MINFLRQVRPPPPTFTEKDIPDLTGRVIVVTGGNSGIGKEVCGLLYSKNATVYMAARTAEKAEAAITALRKAHPTSTGSLGYVTLDFDDLTSIQASANALKSKTLSIDVLINNAGIMVPPAGSVSTQGYELQLSTNCLGPFLFTKLLTPVLAQTAKSAPPGRTRVVWVSSSAAELLSPTGGIEMDNLDYKKDRSQALKYGTSKAGSYFQSTEFARRYRGAGIVSVALNPGNLESDLDRNTTGMQLLLRKALAHPTIFGAYTELFAALSPEVTLEKSGWWIIPWGRFGSIRKDLEKAAKSHEEGSTGIAEQFWNWCEEQVKPYC